MTTLDTAVGSLAAAGDSPGGRGSDQALAARALAVLRVLLLPIIFAGDHLVAHPTVGTRQFDLVFALASGYAVLVLALTALNRSRRGPRVPVGVVLAFDVVFVGALTFESGGAFSQLRPAFLAIPLAAAMLLAPRRTAAVAVATGAIYLLVAITHPATHGTQRLNVTLAQGLYIVWVGAAAVLLSTLLNRRQQRLLAMAAARGRLVAQAVDAEERARRRLSDDLHDHAIQNVLTARQDIADAQAGDSPALARAEHALGQALEQLRSAVRELHPYLLDHLDLPSALETITEQHARHGQYRAHVQIDPAAVGFHDQLVASLARELLGNAAKHAHAAQVNLALARQKSSITLEVSDDGTGFTLEEQTAALRAGHIGLASSRERVEAIGGTFQITSQHGAGTRVRAVIPTGPGATRSQQPQPDDPIAPHPEATTTSAMQPRALRSRNRSLMAEAYG